MAMLSDSEVKTIASIAARAKRINRRRRKQARAQLEDRIVRAKGEVTRLVEAFKCADPELRRIVLFGSLARGRVTNQQFDIDLAVDSPHFMDLLGLAIDSEFPVDLIDLTFCSDYVRSSVRREGLELFHA